MEQDLKAKPVFIGPETQKAMENFGISGFNIDTELIKALAMVKLACAKTNHDLGYLNNEHFAAIIKVCQEFMEGKHHEMIVTDPLQGGAGTSYNMNVNEAIAYLANELCIEDPLHEPILALEHINMHQSTNDVFPTAFKIAVLNRLKELETSIARLQETLQAKETEFSDVIKLGRTELQDAIPMTLGMEFGAFAEAISRDRWRIFKSRERIKTINLGGTAIGTGMGAPRDYIFKVSQELKRISGLSISRAENLVDCTQNLDAVCETSAMTKALAVNLMKIANDLKLLSSGPHGGMAEISLPEMQKGSSIMPGKVNPVIPEAVCQVALRVICNDNLIAMAASGGQLELNAYLPLIAHTFLEDLRILSNTCKIFADKCITGIMANRERCLDILFSSHSLATYLLPVLGYSKVEELVKYASAKKISIREAALEQKVLTPNGFDEIMSPQRMYKLGFSEQDYNTGEDT